MKKNCLMKSLLLITSLSLITNTTTNVFANELNDESQEIVLDKELTDLAEDAVARDFPEYNNDSYILRGQIRENDSRIHVFVSDSNEKFVAWILYDAETDETSLHHTVDSITVEACSYVTNNTDEHGQTYQYYGNWDETGKYIIVDTIDSSEELVTQYRYDIYHESIEEISPEMLNQMKAQEETTILEENLNILSSNYAMAEVATNYYGTPLETVPAEIQDAWISNTSQLNNMEITNNRVYYGDNYYNIVKIYSDYIAPDLLSYAIDWDVEEYQERTGQPVPGPQMFTFTYDTANQTIVDYHRLTDGQIEYDNHYYQAPTELQDTWLSNNGDLPSIEITPGWVTYGEDTFQILDVYSNILANGNLNYFFSWNVEEYEARTGQTIPGPQMFAIIYDTENQTIVDYYRFMDEEYDYRHDYHYYQAPKEIQGNWVSGDKELPTWKITPGWVTYGNKSFQILDVYSDNMNDGKLAYSIAWNVEEYENRTGKSVPGPQMITFVFDTKTGLIEDYMTENMAIQRALDSISENYPAFDQDYQVPQINMSQDNTFVVVQIIDVNEKYYGTFHYYILADKLVLFEDATSSETTKEETSLTIEEVTKVETNKAKALLPATGESNNIILTLVGSVIAVLGIALLIFKTRKSEKE